MRCAPESPSRNALLFIKKIAKVSYSINNRMKTRKSYQHVGFLGPLHLAHARKVLEGVMEVANACRWSVVQMSRVEEFASLLARNAFDGLILGTHDPRVLDLLGDAPFPIVNYSSLHAPRFPSVLSDDREVGRMAARHLRSLGLRHFACFGDKNLKFCRERQEGFRYELGLSGFEAKELSAERNTDLPSLHDLRTLPKPLGLFACNDHRAARICQSCREESIRVPEEIAVVGVDNDPVNSSCAGIPLSSVDLDTPRMGREVARLLDRLMRGEAAPAENVRVPPVGVVARRSSDHFTHEDPEVAKALAYIKEHYCEAMQVGDVLEQASICRRSLETRFRAATGNSIHGEICNLKLQRAEILLRDVTHSVGDVAEALGFSDIYYFSKFFHTKRGLSPTAWRKQHAGR